MSNVAKEQLVSYIDRIEKLQEEKSALSGMIKDVFTEAKSTGFDVKGIKEILKLRKLDSQTREEQEYIVDVYKKTLGMAFEETE
jgi:uncharacterized protein (UPF0335 family)